MAIEAATPPARPLSAELIAPAASRAVWLVAIRELTDQLTSLRFLIIALLAVSLTPLAVYVGTRDYQSRLADYDRLLAERQALAAGPAGKRVRGISGFMGGAQNILWVLRALRRRSLSYQLLFRPGGMPWPPWRARFRRWAC